MRLIAASAIVLLGLLASRASAEDVAEVEPNDDPENVTQELRPGQTFAAGFQEGEDVDHVALVCDTETIVSFQWTLDEGVQINTITIGKLVRRAGPGRKRDVVLHRLRVPAGRTVIRIEAWKRSDTGGYRMETRIEKDDPTLEAEPNNDPGDATPLALGVPLTAWNSATWGDGDYYRIDIRERGIYRVRVERLDPPDPDPGRIRILLRVKTDEVDYHYEVSDLDEVFEFFPVIDPGRYLIQAGIRKASILAPYRLTVTRFKVPVSDETTEAARRAVDRGVVWLIDANDENDRASYEVAAAAMSLMALCEGSGGEERREDRARKVAALVSRLGTEAKTKEDATRDGLPLAEFGRRMYEHAFATLALAEAAAQGSEEARRLCADGVRFLLAAQVSKRRPDAWKVEFTAIDRGSWRYKHDSASGDLSVTGWCLIALYAAAAADIEIEGMDVAAEDAFRYVHACAVSTKGFKYRPSTGGTPSAILQSVGVLLSDLFGLELSARGPASREIDYHLCAGTQAGPGHESPFYYWYYATRANYLRGGYAWEAWRATMMEQLVRRQEEDGTWAPLGDEDPAGRRYSTSMAVLILRLCLGEPPHYLSGEIRGF